MLIRVGAMDKLVNTIWKMTGGSVSSSVDKRSPTVLLTELFQDVR